MNGISRKKTAQDKVNIEGWWTALPIERVRNREVSIQERFLCTLLYSYARNEGTCRPLQETLADDMGVGVRRIQHWLKSLENKGWIRIRRSMYGNHYDLLQPEKILTNTITGSHANTITRSPHLITGSGANTITRSHASMTENHDHLESPHTPPTPPEVVDDDSHRLDQKQDERVGALLRKHGVGAWKKLQKKLAGVEYRLIERRVNTLADQGKGPAIIYKSLDELPFTEGGMDEAGPLPVDHEYWHKQGFVVDSDDIKPLESLLDLSDPELQEYFEQCRTPRK